MARHESEREDLLREATALVERAELAVPGFAEPIVAGFRRDGAASFFFGADPVYQFNARGELRRAFSGGLLFKADRGELAELRRERTAREVALVRRQLDAVEISDFLLQAQERLSLLGNAITAKHFQIIGQVPADADVVGRIDAWFTILLMPLRIAHAPNVAS